MSTEPFQRAVAEAEELIRTATFARTEQDVLEGLDYLAGSIRASLQMAWAYQPAYPFFVHSTNQHVMKGDVDVRGGKTGFITKAGYCLATLLRLPQTNQQVAVVVLGASSNAGRFMETRHLFNWLSTKAQDLVTPVEQPQQP